MKNYLQSNMYNTSFIIKAHWQAYTGNGTEWETVYLYIFTNT